MAPGPRVRSARSAPGPHGRAGRVGGYANAVFLVFVAACAAFVVATSSSLPALVASHFDAAGHANGFMPRTPYMGVMVALVVVVGLVIAIVPAMALRRPDARIHLPHRDYWLAPERRDATIATLTAMMRRFAYVPLAFLVYAHWLVVRANGVSPPLLDARAIRAGIFLFVIATLLFVIVMIARFRSVPARRR
ncbi:MAG TPA: DUF1648 domain-containing protein [Burkholderiaceae bacterium]|nr:DUF1648 domain-containing protein [Burkholderiaceae bacterium]